MSTDDSKLAAALPSAAAVETKQTTEAIKPFTKKDKDPFDLTNLDQATFDKISNIIDSANKLMTPTERQRREDRERDEYEKEKKQKELVDRDARREIFSFSKNKSKQYKFIGYDTDQAIDLNDIANKCDEEAANHGQKATKKWMELNVEYMGKMLQYSLDPPPTKEELKTLSKRELTWLHLVMKLKNEEPLPFDLNE